MKEFRQVRFRVPKGATQLLLIRHGESRALSDDYPFPLLDGQGNPELATTGLAQAQAIGARLADEDIAAIYATSLVRTQQTAAPLAKRLGIDVLLEPDLREIFLGEWEGGKYRRKLAAGDPLFRQALQEQRWDVIPGAESHAQVQHRVVPALQRIIDAHPDQRIAVVIHGGIVGHILSHATGARPFAFTGADNGSISTLVGAHDAWHVRGFNDVSHLDGIA